MVGAGVFAVFAPAAAAAGSALLIGLLLAAVVAYANATSTAQLAARYPSSGGAYLYGRERLGEWPGFLAGWAFVVGKTASCAAMALTAAAYLVPPEWVKPVAAGCVAVLTVVNVLGVTRTARATMAIVVVVLAVLALAVVGGLASGTADPASLAPALPESGVLGVLQSAGLLFFAFAGYARIATLGEEVRDPARTIPRAIPLALALALLVYAAIAVTALAVLGPERLAASARPLAELAGSGGWSWTAPIVQGGAALAALGALLALLAGITRTGLAMARTGDLPGWFAAIDPRFSVPRRAQLVLGAIVLVLVLVTDLRGAIGFSSFAVLLYYLVANLSAWTLPRAERRSPRVLQAVGAIGCVVLAATLPWPSVVIGCAVLAVGVVARLVRVTAARRA
ncbi:APC family permease [Schumannella luteola]|nr:APC family permease [Schumannella luteola]